MARPDTPAPDTPLARRVQQRMDALKLSPYKASKLSGLGPDYVRDILRGRVREPSAERLTRLAATLQCGVSHLIGHDEASGEPIWTAPQIVEMERWASGRFGPPPALSASDVRSVADALAAVLGQRSSSDRDQQLLDGAALLRALEARGYSVSPLPSRSSPG